jgi:hypothetical protein
MRGREWRTLREGDREAVAHATICEKESGALSGNSDWRQEKRNRCAGANHVTQSNALMVAGREVARSTGGDVVTHDTDPSNVVMKPFERCLFELLETSRDDPASLREHAAQSSTQPDVDAVGDQMSPPEPPGIQNELIERQANRSIVRGDNRARTRPDDDLDGNTVSHELLEHTHVARAAQSSSAQHEPDANP